MNKGRGNKGERDKKGSGRKEGSRPSSPRGRRPKPPKTGGKDSNKTAADPNLTRLNKFLANAGVASRREADNLIAAGLVEINGEVITEMGYKVKDTDEVKFNGSLLKKEKKVYVLLNKPKGFITTVDDPKARKTVMDLVGNATRERIYPVGRLDRKTTGVLLFTNDGDLAKKLTHPSHGARKIYEVTLDKNLSQADFSKIKEGLTLSDGEIKVDEISYINNKAKNHVGLVLHSGRNRIVRRIFEHLDYEVIKLDRVFFAGLTKKGLERGSYRRLTPDEVKFLQMI